MKLLKDLLLDYGTGRTYGSRFDVPGSGSTLALEKAGSPSESIRAKSSRHGSHCSLFL